MAIDEPKPAVPEANLIELLYADLGRSYAFYLDGIVDALIRSGRVGLVRRQTDALELSQGMSRMVWKGMRWLCRHRHRRGPAGAVYEALGNEAVHNRDGIGLRLLARDLRRTTGEGHSPLLVSHPLLVAALRGRDNLIYQHGESVVPDESLAQGAGHVTVPTESVAKAFTKAGYRSEQIFVSGLCIESALVRQAAESFAMRRQRLGGRGSLTGAFYTSWAEPRANVDRLIEAAWSTVTAGHRVLVFATKGGRLARRTIQRFTRLGADFLQVTPETPIGGAMPRATLLLFERRREEYALTARLFPEFDFVVAPALERSNWGLGLGLPMMLIGPDIGPFAPLNRRLLLDQSVAVSIDSRLDAEGLGERIRRLHKSSELIAMAEAGWQRRNINGFAAIANWLAQEYSAAS